MNMLLRRTTRISKRRQFFDQQLDKSARPSVNATNPRSLNLTAKRRLMIMDFKDNILTEWKDRNAFVKQLFEFLKDKIPKFSMEHFNKWIHLHPWILDHGHTHQSQAGLGSISKTATHNTNMEDKSTQTDFTIQVKTINRHIPSIHLGTFFPDGKPKKELGKDHRFETIHLEPVHSYREVTSRGLEQAAIRLKQERIENRN